MLKTKEPYHIDNELIGKNQEDFLGELKESVAWESDTVYAKNLTTILTV